MQMIIGIGLTLTLLTAAAMAQQPAATAMKTYSSAADVTALIAKAKSERKDNAPTHGEHPPRGALQRQPRVPRGGGTGRHSRKRGGVLLCD